MADLARVLVVAATARELAPSGGWRVLQCGVGPVEAAATTAACIAAERPAAILHVGIAGARRASGIIPPALVIGRASTYCDRTEDAGPPALWAPRTITPHAALFTAMRELLRDAPLVTIGTSARVGGTAGCDVEAMEGYGVLRAAQLAGVPAIEVRAISNEIEESDRTRWRFAEAFAAMTEVTPRLVEAMARCVS